MFCVECGKANPEGAKFCAFCGTKLFIPAATEPEPPEEQPVSAPVFETPAIKPSARPPLFEASAEQMSPEERSSSKEEKPMEEPAPMEPAPSTATAKDEQSAPEAASSITAQTPAPRTAPQRPMGKTVQPVSANPAQPLRPFDAPHPQPAAPTEEPVDLATQTDTAQTDSVSFFKPVDEDAEPSIDLWSEQEVDEKPARFGKFFFGRKQKASAAEEEWEEDAEEEEEEDLWEGVEDDEEIRPKGRGLLSRLRSEREAEKLVVTSSGTEEMPARKPPVRERRSTLIPKRILRDEDEGFFPDEKEEERRPTKGHGQTGSRRETDDDDDDDRQESHRARAFVAILVAAALLLGCLGLFCTSQGRILLAGFHFKINDADAYRALGDSARASNQIRRAAEAYYNALALDPDDYSTALLVGITQQQICDYDKAAKAYYLCTQLRPQEAEPYVYLIKLYLAIGDTEKADHFRQLGQANTGLADLGV